MAGEIEIEIVLLAVACRLSDCEAVMPWAACVCRVRWAQCER